MLIEPTGPARTGSLTALLLGLSITLVSLATSEPDTSSFAPLLTAAAMLAAALAASRWLARSRRMATPPAWIGIPLGLLGVLPLVAEPLRRAAGATGQPGEAVLFACLQNLLLGLVVCCPWPRFWRISALASLFSVVAAFTLGHGWLVQIVTAVYALAGCLWLVDAYLKGQPRLQLVATRPPRWPLRIVLALAALVAFGGLCAVVPTNTVSGLLPELVPTSGGTRDYDPWGRDGVNDGEALVRAARDPQTTGFAESDLFLTSAELSLYDVLQDMYGEAPKPKRADRAVALPPSQIKETRNNPAHSSHAGREFSTRRAPRPRQPGQQDIAARALFYISGRTPLHLRACIYDRFDGVAWHEADDEQRPLAATLDSTGNCIVLKNLVSGPWLADDEVHTLKIGSLDSACFPTPAHLTALKMESASRLDFFAWVQRGILKLTAAKHIPDGITIDLRHGTIDAGQLRAVQWSTAKYVAEAGPADTLLSAPPHPQVAALARRWAEGNRRGWKQVEAVLTAMKSRCELDPQAAAPAECDDVVAHFLLESQRGPDYQFASATAVVLHTLGYETRVVSGFYARPERFDFATRHTPVLPEDVHFWLEIRLPDGNWTTVEPTPGYQLPGPYFSWSRRAHAAFAELAAGMRRHLPAGVVSLTVLTPAWLGRRWLASALLALLWHWHASRHGAEAAAVAALRLLDRRARLAGNPRARGCTVRSWFLPVARARGCAAEFDALVDLADRATFAPLASRCWEPAAGDMLTHGRLVVRQLSLEALRPATGRAETRQITPQRIWKTVCNWAPVRAWLTVSPPVTLEISESTL